MNRKETIGFPISDFDSLQSGDDASGGQMGRTLESERVNKKRVSGVEIRTNYADPKEKEKKEMEQLFSHLLPYGVSRYDVCDVRETRKENLRYAKMALEYYNKTQNDEFELVKPLHSEDVELYSPGSDCIENWCHVSFIARPKNVASGITQNYFFAELLKKECAGPYNVTSCSILEPNDCGEFSSHGCLICPPSLKLHPSRGKFVSGSSLYRVVEWVWL